MSTKKKKLVAPTKWSKPIVESADLQVAAASLSNRFEQNKEFREQLDTDPINVLLSLGMGSDSVRELILEDAYLREKVGAVGITVVADCTAVSCVCTEGCCVSCWVGSGNGNSIDKTELVLPAEFGAKDSEVLTNPLKANLLKNIIQKGHIAPSFK